MSKYTTGEIARLCGVTVRTVQYYDSRNILSPSAVSEGGRRLYSDEDVQKLKVICFLRELDLPISAIGELMAEEHPEKVIDLLLEQQEQVLRSEISQRQQRLSRLEELKRGLKDLERFSLESIGDVAYMMENKKKLRKVRAAMLGIGIPLEIIEWVTFFYGWNSGIWWPFLLGLAAVIGGSVWMVYYYYNNVKYICPECHRIFRPGLGAMFWAPHTPTTRRLTCTGCGHKGYCVEVYGGADE